MDKKKRFEKIVRDIKEIKIQGARSIAKSALYAYSLRHDKNSRKILENARPTEPMLINTLRNYDKLGYEKTLEHFDYAQGRINNFVSRLIKNNSKIFTHCHSTNVVSALIYAKKRGKKFEVYNTETRPLFQGRKTARELERAGIKVTIFVDSASSIAIEKENSRDNFYADLIFLGADAILNNGVINKVGSRMIAELAFLHKIPLYVIADSWKYSASYVKIEERDFHEVWRQVPKHVKIRNPAFEKIPKKYIRAVISELGILKYDDFLKKVKI